MMQPVRCCEEDKRLVSWDLLKGCDSFDFAWIRKYRNYEVYEITSETELGH